MRDFLDPLVDTDSAAGRIVTVALDADRHEAERILEPWPARPGPSGEAARPPGGSRP